MLIKTRIAITLLIIVSIYIFAGCGKDPSYTRLDHRDTVIVQPTPPIKQPPYVTYIGFCNWSNNWACYGWSCTVRYSNGSWGKRCNPRLGDR